MKDILSNMFPGFVRSLQEILDSKKALATGGGLVTAVLAIDDPRLKALALTAIVIAYVLAQGYVDAHKPST